MAQSPSTPALVRKLPCCWRPRDGFTLEDEDRTIACDGRAPRAAFGSILEAVPDGAHEITFVVYGWNSVVGVAVAAEGGGAAWGVETLGAFFYKCRNATLLSGQNNFAEPFRAHRGGSNPAHGFLVEVRIDWASGMIYFALNGSPFQPAPPGSVTTVPENINYVQPWVHNNGYECKVELVKILETPGGPPADRKPRPYTWSVSPLAANSSAAEPLGQPTPGKRPADAAKTSSRGKHKRREGSSEQEIEKREREMQRQAEIRAAAEEEEEENDDEDEEDEDESGAAAASAATSPDDAEVKSEADEAQDELDEEEQKQYATNGR